MLKLSFGKGYYCTADWSTVPSTDLYWWFLVVFAAWVRVRSRQFAQFLGRIVCVSAVPVLRWAIPDKLAHVRVVLCMTYYSYPDDVTCSDIDVNDFGVGLQVPLFFENVSSPSNMERAEWRVQTYWLNIHFEHFFLRITEWFGGCVERNVTPLSWHLGSRN